ncbi:amine oxidase [Brevibacillus ginsengisoli]|uniref:amine oxidase n=1 Tax=Brevibacillus ginsengisoli TaxID=363854 RepID=UPI003CF5FFE9
MFWILIDFIPLFIALGVNPPILGFSLGLVVAILMGVFQSKRFGEINTIIKVKVLYFVISIAVLYFLPQIDLVKLTQVFIYAILFITTSISLLQKKPFTLQYAKKSVAPDYWEHPLFVSTNYWLTVGWAATFGISLVFSILFILQIVTGSTGAFLTNIWNALGLFITFIVPPLMRKKFRATQQEL